MPPNKGHMTLTIQHTVSILLSHVILNAQHNSYPNLLESMDRNVLVTAVPIQSIHTPVVECFLSDCYSWQEFGNRDDFSKILVHGFTLYCLKQKWCRVFIVGGNLVGQISGKKGSVHFTEVNNRTCIISAGWSKTPRTSWWLLSIYCSHHASYREWI